MRFKTHEEYRGLVESLKAGYQTLGREALQKFSPNELGILYAEFTVDYRIASNQVRDYPHDDLAALKKERAERAVQDVAGYLKETERAKDREMER